MKIGSKIPIATGSYNAGVSTGVASIGVQTQFTYIDIGVNIDMTPTVHYDREVTLKMKIEVLSQINTVTISGVQEPVIGQRTSEQVITLKDGEPSLLAGIITKSDHSTSTALPASARYRSSSTSSPRATRSTTRPRSSSSSSPTSSASPSSPAPTPVRSTLAPAAPSSSAATPPPASPTLSPSAPARVRILPTHLGRQRRLGHGPATRPAGRASHAPSSRPIHSPDARSFRPAVSFTVVPPSSSQSVGSTFQVAVMLSNAHDVFSVPLQLKFNQAVLQLVNVDSGDFLSRDSQLVSISHRDDGNGLVAIATERPPNTSGVSGQGSLCTLTFKAIAAGDSDLTLVKVGARTSTQANLPAVGSQAVVHVK